MPATRQTPYPHDTVAVLVRGIETLNIGHLPSPENSKRSGIPGIPRGGRFSFQDPKKSRKLLEKIIAESREIAFARGVYNVGYAGCRFYAMHALFFPRCPARCVMGHRYFNNDIIYDIETPDGTFLAVGNVEFLNVMYDHIPAAIAGYWSRRNPLQDSTYCIRRYFTFYGAIGLLRNFLFPFVEEYDRQLIAFYDLIDDDAANTILGSTWMEEEWLPAHVRDWEVQVEGDL
ncbi:hypothetical protein QFC24_006374 [Naganishia onofrii]|uniref:Uncharacterized protein n=1 Tax=Naganishia onofrii TaxID=1851511 RepID=A0ACC2X2P5_9TREE|nr:hypothetical protein QFC24_006374 [Naganishia onofrii]